MPNFPFVVSDSLQIGTATISATGNAIVLPAGTTVGATPVATTTEVATGGGPKITNLQITNATWTVLDDTAVDTAGGYVLVTGTNFVTGALVYFNQTPATSVAFVSATALRVTVPALAAATYIVYVINPDGGTAIRVPGLTASVSPAWQTASALPEQYDNAAITLTLVATDATSYTITSGSLPPGLSLNSNTGVITGTVTGVSLDTVYTFTVRATDAQLQDSPRTFTVTIAVSDPYFKLTTLLLSGSALSANTVVKDSSTNNFNLTVVGDARASNFTPYGTGWSVYFDGSGDSLDFATNAAFTMGTGDFTIELWYFCNVSYASGNGYLFDFGSNGTRAQLYLNQLYFTPVAGSSLSMSAGVGMAVGVWYHLACVRFGSLVTVYLNGTSIVSNTNTGNLTDNDCRIGDYGGGGNGFNGFISNFRVVKGTAVYTANFTPATTNLTSVANTSLLTCHVNRFMDGSPNNFAITRNGDAAIRSFNPFNITNTGVNGSMYFDGTGDYVTAPSNATFGPSGDFTFESWLYWTGGSNENTLFCVDVSGGINIGLAFGTGGANWGIGRRAIAVDNEFGTAPIKFTWNHLAVSRQSGTIRAFVNGRLVFSGANTVSYVAGPPGIACIATASTNILQGYISDARFVSAAVYTANFTPATSSLTAIANTQLLTLQYDQPHNNHTFLDSSSNQFLITRNGNATQGTFSPFSSGGYSRYFNGFETYNMGASLAGWGLGIVTLEAWVNVPGQFSLALAYDCVAANSRYVVAISATGKLAVTFTVSTGSQFDLTSVNGITFNTWNHVALEIDARTNTSAVLVAYINGVREVLGTQNMSTQTGLYSNPQIGRRLTGCFSFANENGYVADYRMVKNEFVYTGNFTPPTAPLGTSGALSANSYPTTANVNITWTSANCVALFYGIRSPNTLNAANNSVILTTSSTTSTVSFSPLIPSSVYNPAVHGGSAYFDGTGDSLSIVDNDQFFYSGDFTLEVWCYCTSSATMQSIVSQIATNNRGIGLLTGWTGAATNNKMVFHYSTTGANELNISDPDNLPLFQWTHIAVTRTGTTLSMFVNGTRKATTTVSGSFFNSTRSPIYIGSYSGNSGEESLYPWNGYLSGFRSIRGNSIYDATQTTLTIPTAPATPTANTSILLNFTDAAILDSTGRNVLETVADAKTSSVVTKFTGGSMYFDGTGDWTIIPTSPNFGYGTGDFTIELWLYWTGSGTQTIVSNLTADASTNPHLYIGTNVLKYFTASADRITGPTLSANQWYHIAISRSSGSTRLFVNGTQSGSTYADSNNYGTTAPFALGTYWNNGTPSSASTLSGYVSDLRITKGYARYTANFTAPTAPVRLK